VVSQTDVYLRSFCHADRSFRKRTDLIVEFAKRRRQEGLSIVDAAMEAAVSGFGDLMTASRSSSASCR